MCKVTWWVGTSLYFHCFIQRPLNNTLFNAIIWFVKRINVHVIVHVSHFTRLLRNSSPSIWHKDECITNFTLNVAARAQPVMRLWRYLQQHPPPSLWSFDPVCYCHFLIPLWRPSWRLSSLAPTSKNIELLFTLQHRPYHCRYVTLASFTYVTICSVFGSWQLSSSLTRSRWLFCQRHTCKHLGRVHASDGQSVGSNVSEMCRGSEQFDTYTPWWHLVANDVNCRIRLIEQL